jgi:hypothetical protein
MAPISEHGSTSHLPAVGPARESVRLPASRDVLPPGLVGEQAYSHLAWVR